MSIVHVLPENLVNQIAAGEVVERPASVVKELVENSLDAGADSIVVELKDGGRSFVKVSDNGCGMSREDCEMALQRHATSKISSESDLWAIKTMGFRGEALASIAAVSKFTLKSRKASDVGGTQIDCVGGDIVSIGDAGISPGTKIEIHNLFFNIPARQKYLKQDSTELGHVSALMDTIALAHPQVSFKFIHNDKVIFDLARATDLMSRVADVFGRATAEAMLPVFYGSSIFQIDGFIGKPVISRSTSQHQYIFVNGRPIQHHVMSHRIKAAYHSMLMENKKPVFVLNIKIDPALIDVNVHPRKIEIRFEDQETVMRAVYGCVKTALEKGDLMPKGFTESRNYMTDKFPAREVGGGGEILQGRDFLRNKEKGIFRYAKNSGEIGGLELEPDVSMRPVTQVANSYIVAENSEGLILIDQHAAHERVRYEQLMDQFENQKKSVQPLLVTLQLELSNDEFGRMKENMEIFEGLGFEIEEFSGKTFVVNAVPSFLSGEDSEGIVKGVLDDIANGKSPSNLQGRMETIITYMSCRSAIKFGQRLSRDEMQALIVQMEKLQRPYTCPHGRPTMVSLTLGELEKMFGRK